MERQVKTAMTNIEKKQIDLIKESICVYKKFTECRILFKERRLYFSNIEEFIDDKGRSCLFRLKEMCHELFRNSDEATYKEKLYDMTVGYVFHEAMKLRENLYQIESYQPNSDKVSDSLTEIEKKIVREIEMLTRKAEIRLKEGVKEVKTLTVELIGQLQSLIELYKNNYLLPRFILENEKTLVSIYGKRDFESLLNNLYKDGRVALIFRAAKSYLKSEYFDHARLLFRRILTKDKENKTALFLYMYTSAFHFYFKNKFSRSLIFAEHAHIMDIDIENINVYMDLLEKLIYDLSKEMKRTNKV
ncbi:MAG: hypothetical protein NT178_05625 [Proteobacteria bacterium]|nr:hypothetical protein [Pseudomonadota bacterium]